MSLLSMVAKRMENAVESGLGAHSREDIMVSREVIEHIVGHSIRIAFRILSIKISRNYHKEIRHEFNHCLSVHYLNQFCKS